MDTKKIGTFLKQLRNEGNMTQEQLGERLGVSNKTISRWETGNYMPPVECLLLLSDIYDISINEILVGERVSSEKFTQIAEDNITTTLKEQEKENQIFEKRMILVLVITTIMTMVNISLVSLESLKDVIIFILIIAVGVIANTLNIIALGTKMNTLKQ